MGLLKMIATFIIIFMVVYMILCVLAVFERSRMQVAEPAKKMQEVEITDYDLKLRAENIIETMDVLSVKADMYRRKLDEIHEQIENEKMSVVNNKHELDALNMSAVTTHENKCKIQEKLVKLNLELTKIGREQANRNTTRQ